ncbi:uncharacterized protein LOC112639116 [Camponotus floridanus]|uniref:uncharacterized protein LOC112638365 n=1 Tax=Camponotus floridanus TaxID=104421 RepID=UPI000DC6BC2C|nr:uncharacterized protein LOC112638365 [Camponotus floridanus]XP_025266342.1 uncharacterized protein LOC112638566 [Camponotus floridanus]XP_025266343.1 uncharacterized protein LOC112638567 [Camponotus floridanus]XP_025266344.1 uncharacterized protein LOC112638568 [Camponotus floridanus]XP_025266363.1 uncharacterized protein LOC112638582 [Camponotus floridanus]XP_025267837.1 uncharacterized protein LOC112639116 [Camponotus floridanus]
MVNSRRVDQITNRVYSVREGRVRRREQIRQRFIRSGVTIPRQLFVDVDDIPIEIETAINNHEESEFELSFAPLSLDPADIPENHEHDPLEEPSNELNNGITEIDSDNLSECSTVILDEVNSEILFSAWEENAEIHSSRNINIQISPPSTPQDSPPSSPVLSPLWPGYMPPSYSPLTLEDIEDFERSNLQREVEPLFSDEEEADRLADEYASALIESLDRSIAEDEE